MLEDFIFSDRLRYEQHAFILDLPDDTSLRLEGVLGAALLSAKFVDTDEGNRRGIAIDSSFTPGFFRLLIAPVISSKPVLSLK